MAEANPYRDLPRVDDLVAEYTGSLPERLLTDVIRQAVDKSREGIQQGLEANTADLIEEEIRRLRRLAGVPVINATGVLLHTNLGRARWSDEAVAGAANAAAEATNLELDIETGTRSRRGSYVTELLRVLTGAQDAMVVNNNASALVLALAATATGKSVPVARGELIEIGGSYRLPDVMRVSGTELVEVGTTNRVRVGDYETALQIHRAGAVLKIHPSNYRVEGFTSDVGVAALAQISRSAEVPLIFDIGSGLLDAQTPWLHGATPEFLAGEPAARQAIDDGADLVTFSGDKLLGGPQAGAIVGSAEMVDLLRNHPLARALRVDGVTLTALSATLEAYANGDAEKIPFWAQATTPYADLERRCHQVASEIQGIVREGQSAIGGGSVPGLTIDSPNIVIEGRDDIFECLLATDTPLLARREGGDLILDLRTVDKSNDAAVVDAVKRCL